MNKLKHEPVLITGASTGIGSACARQLSAAGFNVFAGVRKTADGDALRDRCAGNLTPVILDVTDPSSITDAVETVAGVTGRKLYGLINNAGVSFGGPLECLSTAEIKKLLDVNVVGMFAVTKACLPLLRQNGGGRIVNTGSISGLFAFPGLSAYAASKYAVEALSDSLRLEVKPFNIFVTVIEPGNVQTPIFEKSKLVSDNMTRNSDKSVLDLYSPVNQALNRLTVNPSGMPVDVISGIVNVALTVKTPKTRYLVGTDAKVLRFIGRFPDRLRDRLTLMVLRKMATA